MTVLTKWFLAEVMQTSVRLWYLLNIIYIPFERNKDVQKGVKSVPGNNSRVEMFFSDKY